MIIDAHAHAWPDAVADRALSGGIPDMPLYGDGKVADLEASMQRAGIDRTVVLAVANTPDRLDNANAFVGGLDRGLFIPFGSIHAGASPETNVASLRANNLPGAKVHPIFQKFSLDDSGLLATLDAMRGEFAVTIHVGAGGGSDGSVCSPAMLADLARQLPGLDIIGCHLGGYHLIDDAEDLIIGKDIYIDTSWPPGLSTVDPHRVRSMIERHGAERVLFATDWPTADQEREVHAITELGLSESDTTAILGGNLERILKL